MTKALSKRSAALALKHYPPAAVQELKKLEQDLGGRSELVALLTLAPLTPDLRYILGHLGDPQHQRMTLAEICTNGNILPGELLKQLSSAALLKGKVLASQAIGNGIAAVAKDVMRRAAPYEAPCNSCQGIGATTPDPTPAAPNPSPIPCEVCRGTGRLVYEPELDRQKLAMDLAQLLPKSSGIQIAQINTSQAGSGQVGTLEALQKLTDRLLYGSGTPGEPDEPSEGEVVHSAPTDPDQPSGVAGVAE